MKRLFFLLTFFMTALSVSAYTTDTSKYVEQQYRDNDLRNIKLNVKKEHTNCYNQQIGENIISSITYGFADMKERGKRKMRVSYICVYDKNCEPLFAYIIPR